MEFSGMSKTSEEPFGFLNPTTNSHPVHLYNSLQCSPNSEFGEKSVSDASPDEHVIRLVGAYNCSFNNGLRDCENFKSPVVTSNRNCVAALDISLSISGNESFEIDHSKVSDETDLTDSDKGESIICGRSLKSPDIHGLSEESCTPSREIVDSIPVSGHVGNNSVCISSSSCNGSLSRPESNGTLPSPSSKSELTNDCNGCFKPRIFSPSHEQDRTKMDLDKLDNTIDYVLSAARSDEPYEGMFVLSCRMREPTHMSSPNVRANTPSSGLVTSPTLSPASSPHSNQLTSSPMVVQTSRSHSVFQPNTVCSMITPQPVQRYIVDQTHSILHLSSNPPSQCTPSQYNNQSVSFVQLCSDSPNSNTQTTHHIVSQIGQPLTTSAAHVVFHSGVLHNFSNHTSQPAQFTLPHSTIPAASVQRIQNPVLSPVKSNLMHTVSNQVSKLASPDAPVSTYSILSRTPETITQNLSNNTVSISPSNICVVRTPIQSPQSITCAPANPSPSSECLNDVKSTCNSSPHNDKKITAPQVAVTFRQPIVPAQSSAYQAPINSTANVMSTSSSTLNQEQISSTFQNNISLPKKRSNSTVPGSGKRRKTSVTPVSSASPVYKNVPRDPNVSPGRVTHSVAQECFEKLKIVDVKSFVSAPALQPYTSVLPPSIVSEFPIQFSRCDEVEFIRRRGLKYVRGPMSLSLPKCTDPAYSCEMMDSYITQHLQTTTPPGPTIHSSKRYNVNGFSNTTSVCASPEPPSFENHMMSLFSRMHQFAKMDTKQTIDRPDSDYNTCKLTVETRLPHSLLQVFSHDFAESVGKSETDRCTPPLALHHMPNPRLLLQPIPSVPCGVKTSDNPIDTLSTGNTAQIPSIKPEQISVKNQKLSSLHPAKTLNQSSFNNISINNSLIDSETGEVVVNNQSKSPIQSHAINPTLNENDKLHITFTINPSVAVSIPNIIHRITELLGVEEDSVDYQITRLGAQITLDQKQSQSDFVMRSLETHLRQQFTPLSLHFEKESTRDSSDKISNDLNQSNLGLSRYPESYSPLLPQSNLHGVENMTKSEFVSTQLFGSNGYPEELISISSLLASKHRSTKFCKNCDKPVPSYLNQYKWQDDLNNKFGIATRVSNTGDFVFCSNDCLSGFAQSLSQRRSKYSESTWDYSSHSNSQNSNCQALNSDSTHQIVVCDLPHSVPVLLHNSSHKSSRTNNLKRVCTSSQHTGFNNKRRATNTTIALSKFKKWRGVRWRPFTSETTSSHNLSRKNLTTEELLQLLRNDPSILRISHSDDKRVCTLCSLTGDTTENGPGRLLPLDLDRWVHINCALWCYEVYETVGGSLNSIDVWLDKAVDTCCSHCKCFGAGLPCYNPKCSSVYHVPCALEIGCMFFTDRGMYCPLHQPREAHPMQLLSLMVNRRVYISRDENSQVARVVHEEDRSHFIRIGSVCLHSVGQLLPHQLDSGYFHTRRHIYPVGLRTTRIYWSMRKPRCRARYICEIVEQNCRPLFRISVIDKGMEDEVITHESCDGVWQIILTRIESLRKENKLTRLFPKHLRGEDLYGLSEPHIVRAIESIPGVDSLRDYVFNFGRLELISEMPLAINPSGCARAEPKMQTYVKRFRIDHSESNTLSGCRTSSLLGIRRLSYPVLGGCYGNGQITSESAMSKQQQSSRSQQYRRLKAEVNSNVILGRSRIQGLGLFAARDLEQQTMVIEYIGELIRLEIANKREKDYEAHNRGIYMFRLDDDTVIDATVCGGLARYINHSCQPNCFAEHVTFGDQSHIVIITNRRIKKGEELCYDYNFDLEDRGDKIPCLCRAPNCRKWMN